MEPGKWGAKLLEDLSKKGRKGADLFLVWFCTSNIFGRK
jgi:hypothetical protein